MAEGDPRDDDGAEPRAGAFRYAMIDLAVAEALRSQVAGLQPPVGETLFDRRADRRLLLVAPWLVRLSLAQDIGRRLEELGPSLPWGCYVYSTVDISSLRAALRRFNIARLPNSARKVLFRYWDPRVMRVFLAVANKAQRELLFEWIERIEAPDRSFAATAPRTD
jgi:hypothetical protein